MNLTLVGVSPYDFKAYERAIEMLEFFKPEKIVIDETEREFKAIADFFMANKIRENLDSVIRTYRSALPYSNATTMTAYVLGLGGCHAAIETYEKMGPAQIRLVDIIEEGLVEDEKDVKITNKIRHVADSSIYGTSVTEYIDQLLMLNLDIAQKQIERDYDRASKTIRPGQAQSYANSNERLEEIIRGCGDSTMCFANLGQVFGKYKDSLPERLADISPLLIKLNQAENFLQMEHIPRLPPSSKA